MDEEKINRLMNEEKIKQSIAYAADLIDQLESDPQLISVMNYAVDVKTLVRCAESWLMVLEMEPSQALRRNWQEDPHAYKWIATDRRGQQYYDDQPELALQKAIID